MQFTSETELCLCGSGKQPSACCSCLHRGQDAETAEALMRARFTAYALRDEAFLLSTWHSSTRPVKLDLRQDPTHWFKLDIIRTEQGSKDDNEGLVEFIATYSVNDEIGQLHEESYFLKQNGKWYYVDGQIMSSRKRVKIGRNETCYCGSGKKYKLCCGN